MFNKLNNSITEKELYAIHQTSVRILSEIGIKLSHTRMIQSLNNIGCHLKNERVLIPETLVSKVIDEIPNNFNLYGREVDNYVEINSEGPILCTNTGIIPYFYDFETGKIRRSTLYDVEITTRVMDALSEVDVVYISLLDATDIYPHLVTIKDFIATLSNTVKPMVGPGISNRNEAKAIIDIALTLRNGDIKELSMKPMIAPFVAAVTPLTFNDDAINAIEEIATAGLPLISLTNPIMGATAPYTIAGTVALGHAEMLAIAVIAHTINPCLPIISFNTPTVADMQTLSSTTGGPETGLLRSLAVRLANYLGIPSWGHGHTSSTRMDEQAAEEKSINTMLIAEAKPSLLGGLGGLANVTLTSFETLILDNERFSAIKRVMQGISIDEDHLAFEVINDIVNNQSVVSHGHTIKYLRSNEVWKPRIVKRHGLVNGQPERTSIIQRAKEEAINIINTHKVNPLSEKVIQNIQEIIDEYDLKYKKSK